MLKSRRFRTVNVTVSFIMNLIITLEKEFKGEDIENLNKELSDAFIQIILSNNEVLKN